MIEDVNVEYVVSRIEGFSDGPVPVKTAVFGSRDDIEDWYREMFRRSYDAVQKTLRETIDREELTDEITFNVHLFDAEGILRWHYRVYTDESAVMNLTVVTHPEEVSVPVTRFPKWLL